MIENNTNPTYDKAQALRLYVEQSKMDTLLGEDMERYRVALAKTGGAVDDIEPISRFHEAFQGEVDVAYAAAVVGLETETLLEKIRENVGLQNAGLLVLASPNGSMKRDAWTSSFRDIVFALNFPTALVVPPVVTPPERPPGAVVQIPDSNLHAAIAEALGKSPTAPITVEDMEGLEELEARDKDIQDLTGMQFAKNLGFLALDRNQISDLSPIARLINLRVLLIQENLLSDISPVRGLTNLTNIEIDDMLVSDLSPLAGLINLKRIHAAGNSISDLSPIVGLPKLETLYIPGSEISDLTPLASFTGLTILNLGSNKIPISDISPLAGLTNLGWLILGNNEISDISPLASLTGLTRLDLRHNNISDLSPLAGLTNLKWLEVSGNNISDLSPLEGLRENITLIWYDNPAFPKGGPKIEGPWLWVALPSTRLSSRTDLLAKASGGAVTETEIATHGAIVGQSVGDSVWTAYNLPPTGQDNITHMLRDSIYKDSVHPNPGAALYGSVSLYSPREQNTTMYVGGDDGVKVWINGTLIYGLRGVGVEDYGDFFPVTLQQGRNVLLVAVHTWGNGFFGFEPGTEYTVSMGVGYTFSKTPIHVNDTFTLDIRAENITDLAGWQFDITFDPAILEAINVTEGDFLKKDGGTTFFQGGSTDNANGTITGLSAIRLSAPGVSGTGTLLQVRFKAKQGGETELVLQKFQFGSATGDNIPTGPHQIRITVEGRLATGDVNRDGVVSILDLILIAQQLGRRVPAGSPVDLNSDGVVSILDLILTARSLGSTTAPAAPVALNPDLIGAVGADGIDPGMIEAWIAQARLEDDGSLAFKQGIENLQNLLDSLIPEETALLHNYPNPFNPETWIPYQLAESAEVMLTIYDMNGQMVRRLSVGYQGAGMYHSRSRAAYWDGRNQLGEPVASGLYFYTLTADDFTATRRMLILK